jgi:hypothetical protein
MRGVMVSVLVGVVLVGVVDVGAAEWEEDTIGWWAGLPAVLGVAYLAGALEVLDAVGLACPAAVTVGDVETRLRGRLPGGGDPGGDTVDAGAAADRDQPGVPVRRVRAGGHLGRAGGQVSGSVASAGGRAVGDWMRQGRRPRLLLDPKMLRSGRVASALRARRKGKGRAALGVLG